MKNLSWKGKLIIAAVIIVLVILIIVGIKYLPIWSTIEAVVMFAAGFFLGWMAKKLDIIKKERNEVKD